MSRQAIYCSKECQVKQWKTHKRYCVAYADIVPPLRDPTNPVEVYNRTVDIMFDEAFSKWFMRWWRPLSRMTLAGVDLGKYPERAETHCMVIWAVPNFNLRGSTDSFQGRGYDYSRSHRRIPDRSALEGDLYRRSKQSINDCPAL
ncbi:hypothetical protein PHLGIDRAFT_486700 [Phlebiopsis gigantea 11061_1 CR5-6]|uniref:MYND-type domain-containing protein n=1 Tax=Phlebiopsis gigantea (strain 11061_1 CR5-6) TaxID=745531 RepID=A0A0C3S8X5_PHLG1|nr:hypothetical protein PHLGIDRAFT_486700 [Phlebiopsis gigantea 11061_1 CR5-6]